MLPFCAETAPLTNRETVPKAKAFKAFMISPGGKLGLIQSTEAFCADGLSASVR